MSVFIIAEAGVNHNGSEERAMQLVEAAAECGADAVKFQTFSADKLVKVGTSTASYQQKATGHSDQHALLKSLELSHDAHEALFEKCAGLGIEFMSTAFDEASAEFLRDLGVRRFKVPSGEITNDPFLRFLARLNLPLIVSTGMANMPEIKHAVAVLKETSLDAGLANVQNGILTILHCTSNYPAKLEDINLRAMQTIAMETGLPVGYSDHSLGIAVSTAATALGATVIEKHFTLDRELPGPDHAASLTVPELKAMVEQIRDVEAALGSSEKRPNADEIPVRELVRRSLTADREIKRGATLMAADIAILRPGNGISPGSYDAVVGKRATRQIAAGTTLQWSDVE